MSKRDQRRVKVSDFKDRKRREGGLEIEMDDGTVYEVDPPQIWPDEIAKIPQDEPDKLGEALLGEEKFAQFVEQGGSGIMIMAMLEERHEVEPGK